MFRQEFILDRAKTSDGSYPVNFRAEVPEKGTYAIVVGMNGGTEGLSHAILYSGRRNLVKRDICLAPGETFTYRYYVQMCEYIPVVGKPEVLDLSVSISLLGKGATFESVIIEEVAVPTIFLAGDSLVADCEGVYPYNPIMNIGSWGQNILQYFDRMAVCNQAHGGMTTNCFREDGHWDIISRNLKAGDVVMMEFGHNDQKRRYLKAYGQYAANLRWYILQIRKKGAYPVLVTSLSRIPNKDDDGYYDYLEEYADSCLRTGRECHVPVLNLHEYSFKKLCAVGTDVGKHYFVDTTHTNDYGALFVAQFLANEIRRQQIKPMILGMNDFCGEPWEADVSLYPAQKVSSDQKQERPILSTELPELPYEDCQNIPHLDLLKEAMVKGLLDPCIRFFHPFDEMPRGQFLYLFFKAVHQPKKRPYQGTYCDIYKYEFDSQFVQMALDSYLIDMKTTPDERFRPDDGLLGGELVSLMVRSLHRIEERARLTIVECELQAEELGLLWDGYEREKKVNRLNCTVTLVQMMHWGPSMVK